MSADGHFDRSADHFARWFSTGIDDARRSPGAEHANRSSLDVIAHSQSMQQASSTLGLGLDAERGAAIDRGQPQPPDINRHRR